MKLWMTIDHLRDVIERCDEKFGDADPDGERDLGFTVRGFTDHGGGRLVALADLGDARILERCGEGGWVYRVVLGEPPTGFTEYMEGL